MVVTRLWEVTTKGKDALSSTSPSNTSTSPTRPSVARGDSSTGVDDEGSYWDSAVNSMQNAATSVSGKVSSLFGADTATVHAQDKGSFYSSYNPFSMWTDGSSVAASITTSRLNVIDEFDDDDQDSGMGGSNVAPFHISRRSMKANPWSNTPHADLLWMFRHDKNPYSAVRGRDTQPYSMTAVRSLVALVPSARTDPPSLHRTSSEGFNSHLDDETEVEISPDTSWSMNRSTGKATEDPESLRASPPPPYELRRQRSDYSATTQKSSGRSRRKTVSASETASQLAEGTIRALRDLALDEAVELQMALRFWNDRWERPLLSWLEAGPLGMSMVVPFLLMIGCP